MTFKELQDDTLERLTFDPALGTSATPRVRVKRFLNESYRRILRSIGLGRLLTSTSTTTIVLAVGTKTYSVTAAKIKSIYSATTGVLREITLDEIRAADPTELAQGTPEAYAVEKVSATTLTIRPFPIPSSIITLAVDCLLPVTALSGDNDVAVIPEDYHWLLVAGARMLEYERMEQLDRYRIAKNEFDQGMRDLRYFVAKSGKKATLPGYTTARASQFGPYFTE